METMTASAGTRAGTVTLPVRWAKSASARCALGGFHAPAGGGGYDPDGDAVFEAGFGTLLTAYQQARCDVRLAARPHAEPEALPGQPRAPEQPFSAEAAERAEKSLRDAAWRAASELPSAGAALIARKAIKSAEAAGDARADCAWEAILAAHSIFGGDRRAGLAAATRRADAAEERARADAECAAQALAAQIAGWHLHRG